MLRSHCIHMFVIQSDRVVSVTSKVERFACEYQKGNVYFVLSLEISTESSLVILQSNMQRDWVQKIAMLVLFFITFVSLRRNAYCVHAKYYITIIIDVICNKKIIQNIWKERFV